MFGEAKFNRPKNLELLIEASCCRYAKVVTKSHLHEFLQQKCFFADTHLKRHIPPMLGLSDIKSRKRALWKI
jgi:hypothetical protein